MFVRTSTALRQRAFVLRSMASPSRLRCTGRGIRWLSSVSIDDLLGATPPDKKEHYDIVVIGGGSGGIAAAREVCNVSVGIPILSIVSAVFLSLPPLEPRCYSQTM